jgi:hypothetical protein
MESVAKYKASRELQAHVEETVDSRRRRVVFSNRLQSPQRPLLNLARIRVYLDDSMGIVVVVFMIVTLMKVDDLLVWENICVDLGVELSWKAEEFPALSSSERILFYLLLHLRCRRILCHSRNEGGEDLVIVV